MQLLWPSWCMVTNCKQQLECELDLSELPFNALLHSYCSGIILVFCRGEEECHFLVSIFTGIQMHSNSVQLPWHVCHAILTTSRRTVILEGRICSHCALDSEEMQHRTLGSAGLREDMSQIFLSRQIAGSAGEVPRAGLWWGQPSGSAFSCLFSPPSAPRVILHHKEDIGQSAELRCLICLPCQCSKIYEPWKLLCKRSWLSNVEPVHSTHLCLPFALWVLFFFFSH